MVCPNCASEIPTEAVEPDVLDAKDVIEYFGGKVGRDTINEWFHSRVLHGFRVPGTRGWLITVAQFQADVKRLSRNNPPKRVLLRSPKAGLSR